MALPTFVAAGASFQSTASVSASFPTGRAVGDILLLFVETADQAIGTPQGGWTKVAEISNSGQTRLTVFALRYVAGSSVTVPDSGDHQVGAIIAIRGASGLPNLVVTDSGTESGAGQTQNMDGGTTTENDCFIVIGTAHGVDISSVVNYSGWANANLANVTERVDVSTSQGNGGGVGVATGELATAGAIGTSTVVNGATSPPWVSAVLAFPPPDPPANDDFANAEPLVDGLTQSIPGSTFDATTEASEDLTTFFSETLDRTQWWIYDAPVRQIVKFRMVSPTGSIGILSALRGSSVSTTSRYSTPAIQFGGTGAAAFGQEAERGLLNEWKFSVLSSDPPSTFNRAQVDPAYPLLLQSGRRTSFGPPADFAYEIEFESFTPPANDDFDDAEEILVPDLDPIDIAYDLEPATQQPGFVPSFHLASGDLWYHLNLASDTPIGIGIVKDNIGDNARPIYALIWSGSVLGSLTLISQVQGSYVGDADPALVQFNFEAGQDYYIQLLNDPSAVFLEATDTGTLHLQPYAIPPNDDFADAEDLGTADSGSTGVANAQGSSFEVDEPGFGGYSIWYEFTPTNGGWYEFTVGDDPAFWSLHAYRGVAVNALEWVSGVYFLPGDTKTLALRGGETYHIQLDGASFDYGTLAWNLVSPAPANDDEADATVITGASGTESSDIEGATNEAGELRDNPDWIQQEATSWFEWVAPATDYYSFETSGLGPGSGSNYMVALAVWETDTTGDPLVENLDGKDDIQGKLAFAATSGETYLIRVTFSRDFNDYPNYFTWTGPFTFDLSWDTFVPADNNLFADSSLIAAAAVDELVLENYGLPAATETDFPDLIDYFVDDIGIDSQYGRARWFDFVPDHTGTYDIDVVANGSMIVSAMFTGTVLADLVPVAASESGLSSGNAGTYSDHGDNSTSGPYTVDLVEGETYRIVIAGFLWSAVADVPEWWISQGDFTLSWRLHPSENDNYSDVQSTSFGNDNIGNLNYFYEYSYGGVDYGEYGVSFGSGGCREVSNLAATAEPSEPAILGFGPTRTLWFLFRPSGVDDYFSDQGDYKFWVEGVGPTPCLDPLLAVYHRNGSNITSLGAPLGADDDTNGLYPEVIVNNLFSFDPLMIQVDARDEGDFRLLVQRVPPGAPPANDNFADATDITAEVTAATPFNVSSVNATVECGEQLAAGFWDGPYGSVWFKWDSLDDQEITLTMDSVGIDSDLDYQLVDIFEGTALDNLINLTPADDGDGNASYDDIITMSIDAEAGKTYYFRFSAYADQAWSGTTATITAFGDKIRPDFIAPTTTVFPPFIEGDGNVNLAVPFIAPTGGTRDPYLFGPQDIPVPFIDSTTTVTAPILFDPDRNYGRLSHEPAEAVVLPDDQTGRVSQEPVEAVVLSDPAGRISQEPVEVVVLGSSYGRISQEPTEAVVLPTDQTGRISQEPAEVVMQNLHEQITVIWIP